MSRFNLIDDKLTEFAKKLNAKLTKDRPGYPEVLRTFEERRIDWIEDNINKAIIIQPTFEATGVDSSIWNFINIAWYDDAYPVLRRGWINKLVDKREFELIENNIDILLNKSEVNLKKITMADLK